MNPLAKILESAKVIPEHQPILVDPPAAAPAPSAAVPPSSPGAPSPFMPGLVIRPGFSILAVQEPPTTLADGTTRPGRFSFGPNLSNFECRQIKQWTEFW